MKDIHVRNSKSIAMKKIIIVIAIVLAGTVFFLARNFFQKNDSSAPASNISANIPIAAENQNDTQNAPDAIIPTDNRKASSVQNSDGFLSPLDRAAERVTKKPFGIYITPQNSPIQPEKFQGYHTGADFEIFPEEQSAEVPVRAICNGKIAVKRFASGYGGILVQNCNLNSHLFTVIYGHLKLASLSKNAGDNLNAGDEIGILGKAGSIETDGERKHLHLGIHRGPSISILGYVSSQSQLSGWVDPCSLICK